MPITGSCFRRRIRHRASFRGPRSQRTAAPPESRAWSRGAEWKMTTSWMPAARISSCRRAIDRRCTLQRDSRRIGGIADVSAVRCRVSESDFHGLSSIQVDGRHCLGSAGAWQNALTRGWAANDAGFRHSGPLPCIRRSARAAGLLRAGPWRCANRARASSLVPFRRLLIARPPMAPCTPPRAAQRAPPPPGLARLCQSYRHGPDAQDSRR